MGWDSIVVKKGTPPEVLDKLRAAYKKVATDPEIIAKLENIKLWLDYKSPEECIALWEKSHEVLSEGFK